MEGPPVDGAAAVNNLVEAEMEARAAMAASPIAFYEYPSIDVKGRKTRAMAQAAGDAKWVVLEKIHGCNFSFICDGTHVRAARRTDMLDDVETFYGWQKVRDKIKEKVTALHKDLVQILAEQSIKVLTTTVFGELFGGIYPHPDVPDLGLLHCQKGVYYSNDVEYSAYDILCKLDATPEGSRIGPHKWINYDLAMSLFEKHGFFYSKPLLTDSLERCQAFETKINSTIPGILGLPELAQNQMEGVIVKSVEPLFTAQGKRFIVKIKNPKFEEVNPKVPKTLYEQQKEKERGAAERCYEEIERYINNNRMDTLRSKFGEVTAGERAVEAAELYTKDVLKDFLNDNEELWRLVPEAGQERIEKNTRSLVNNFIAAYLAAQQAPTTPQN